MKTAAVINASEFSESVLLQALRDSWRLVTYYDALQSMPTTEDT